MPKIATMCPMNCHPTLCGMTVETEDDQLVSISGDVTHPDSKGNLCMRGQAAHEIVGNELRLKTPLIREDDGFRPATWDEALDLICGKLSAMPPEAFGIWGGHGLAANDYGVSVKGQLIERFANAYGCQRWKGQMICWGLGGFGFGLTGALDVSTKEDMGANSDLIIMWGANTASQKNTTPHLIEAKGRGARIVTIDVRKTEAAALSAQTLLVRPGGDVPLALAMMNVLIAEGLCDEDFIADHTVGFDALATHVADFTPEWAAGETGLAADEIRALARDYSRAERAMIVAGGSSLHKGGNGWMAARAIGCLPALTGQYGKEGGGLGPRHGVHSSGRGLGMVAERPRPLPYTVPNQMEAIIEALEEGRVRAIFTPGSNPVSSFADAGRMARALDKAELVIGYDIFMSETIRNHADVVLPATIWLEEIGLKATATHIHLCDKALPTDGEGKPIHEVLTALADRLGAEDVYPWDDHEEVLNAILDHPCTGNATVADLRAAGGRVALDISHVAYPNLKFDTQSGKIEFYSEKAAQLGLPPLPSPVEAAPGPLALAHGRTLTHFHSFYDQGQALPTLKARNSGPELWLSPNDAKSRGVSQGAPVSIRSPHGSFNATALITPKMPDGAVWMRDGWAGENAIMNGASVLPEAALETFPFSVGQAHYGAGVEVSAL
ncbi:MAG: molybdopterin-dependent oxidoreductase [Pseudomonadota bacterium]